VARAQISRRHEWCSPRVSCLVPSLAPCAQCYGFSSSFQIGSRASRSRKMRSARPKYQYPILTPLECGFASYLFERCTPTAAPISGGAEQCPSRALIRALMLRYVAKRSAGSGLPKVRN